MARERRLYDWDHTASLVAAVLNARQGLKKHQLTSPAKIHPYRSRERRVQSIEESRSTLRRFFGTKSP